MTTLFSRAKTVIPGGVNSPVRSFKAVSGEPFFTESALGARLFTADGRTLVDYVGTWGPAIHGHNCAEIRDALSEALGKGTSFGTPSPPEVAMAEKVVSLVPSVEKVRMCNSGTEATMSAIRLARGYTGRDKIIKFAGCYHGHGDSLLVQAGSGALTLGKPDSAGVPECFAEQTIVLPFNDFTAIDRVFSERGEEIAGLIVEPYPANCGLMLPLPGYLEHLRKITARHQTILIFDEVMTGFRVALGGVQEREGVTPDLTTLGKIIGGGLPVGALGGKSEIMDFLAPDGPVYQAGTLSGNPMAMVAGLTSIKKLEQENPYRFLEEKTDQLKEGILAITKEKGIAVQVPTVPSMLCVYFSEQPVTSFEEVMSSSLNAFPPLFHSLLGEGIYWPPSPFETAFISTVHDNDLISQTLEAFKKAFEKL